MPHPAPQRDRTTIAMIMRGNRSATDNIWPEAARGHLARGRISGQRPCDRPRQGPSLPLIVRFVWVYWTLQLILLRATDFFFLDPCWLRPLQAPTDHLHEEPFFHSAYLSKESSLMSGSQLCFMLRHPWFKHGPHICPHSHHPDGSRYVYHRALIMRLPLTSSPHAAQERGSVGSTSIAAAT